MGGSVPIDIRIALPFVNDIELVRPLCPKVEVMINHGWPKLFADSAISTEKLGSSLSTLVEKHTHFIQSYLKDWVNELELLKKRFNDEKEAKEAKVKVKEEQDGDGDCNQTNDGNENEEEVTQQQMMMPMSIQPDLIPHYVSSASSSEQQWDEQFFDQDSEFGSDDEEINTLSLVFELDFIQNYQRSVATTNEQIMENKLIAKFNQDKLEELKNKLDVELFVSFRRLKYDIQKNLSNIERQLEKEELLEDFHLWALFMQCKDENLRQKEQLEQQLEAIDGYYSDIDLFGKFF